VSAAVVTVKQFAPILDIFQLIFGTLPHDPIYSEVYLRFLLWLLMYGIFRLAIRHTPFFNKEDAASVKYTNIIVIVVSLLGVIFIPSSVIYTTAQSFSFIVSMLILIFIPIVLFNATKESTGVVRGVVFLAMGVLLLTLTPFMLNPYSMYGTWATDLADWVMTTGALLMLLGIIFLFSGGSQALSGAGLTEAAKEGAGKVKNWFSRSPERKEAFEKTKALESPIKTFEKSVEQYKDEVSKIKAADINNDKMKEIAGTTSELLQSGYQIFNNIKELLEHEGFTNVNRHYGKMEAKLPIIKFMNSYKDLMKTYTEFLEKVGNSHAPRP
jgi:small-conductance mechanosensitive channel